MRVLRWVVGFLTAALLAVVVGFTLAHSDLRVAVVVGIGLIMAVITGYGYAVLDMVLDDTEADPNARGYPPPG